MINSQLYPACHKIDLKSIIIKHKTPLFLYHSETIIRNIEALKRAFHGYADVFYSYKANPNISICALMLRNGVHAEICSHLELLLARKVGFLPQNIIFVGPGKSEHDLKLAVEMGIFSIVVENLEEISILQTICKKLKKKASIAIRVNPTFSIKDAPLKMGGVASQFGLSVEEILSNKDCFQNEEISLMGLHVYNGTRILNAKNLAENCIQIFQLAADLSCNLPMDLAFLDLGGGFGIPYFDGENEFDILAFQNEILSELTVFKKRFPKTRLGIESGRYLVGSAGSFFSQVLYLKESYGKKFAITDGGMNCHMAATGLGSFLRRNFPISILSSTTDDRELYTITGPLCTPSDYIGQGVSLPKLKVGDIIQVEMSGAYGPSASPGLFLSHGFPKEIMIHGDEDYVIRKEDNFDNVFGNHVNIFKEL